jgi:hypothetical protein
LKESVEMRATNPAYCIAPGPFDTFGSWHYREAVQSKNKRFSTSQEGVREPSCPSGLAGPQRAVIPSAARTKFLPLMC